MNPASASHLEKPTHGSQPMHFRNSRPCTFESLLAKLTSSPQILVISRPDVLADQTIDSEGHLHRNDAVLTWLRIPDRPAQIRCHDLGVRRNGLQVCVISAQPQSVRAAHRAQVLSPEETHYAPRDRKDGIDVQVLRALQVNSRPQMEKQQFSLMADQSHARTEPCIAYNETLELQMLEFAKRTLLRVHYSTYEATSLSIDILSLAAEIVTQKSNAPGVHDPHSITVSAPRIPAGH